MVGELKEDLTSHLMTRRKKRDMLEGDNEASNAKRSIKMSTSGKDINR